MNTYCPQIEIITGDITKLQVDAIVNAANKTLLGGGGVDGAIHRAAGKGLVKECATLGGCETGQSKITAAYNLPCRHVIHTVGPVWHDGHCHEPELLASCYNTALDLAEQNGITTIAFPCISTGVYHFPKDDAARIALHTIFARIRDGFKGKVTFCCFSKEDAEVYEAYFWEESLTLLGHRQDVRMFRHEVDLNPEKQWDKALAVEDKDNLDIDTLLNFIPICDSYPFWSNHFMVNKMDFGEVNDLYCLVILFTFLSRVEHRTGCPVSPDKTRAVLKAIHSAYIWNRYIRYCRTIEEMHKLGYEKIRINPCMSPNGCPRSILTVKSNTSKLCGAMCDDMMAPLTHLSNYNFKAWNMMELSPYDNAKQFLQAYPDIAAAGQGRDSVYARWYKLVVRNCYLRHLPYTYADYYNCLDEGNIRLTGIGDRRLPFPPPGDSDKFDY